MSHLCGTWQINLLRFVYDMYMYYKIEYKLFGKLDVAAMECATQIPHPESLLPGAADQALVLK